MNPNTTKKRRHPASLELTELQSTTQAATLIKSAFAPWCNRIGGPHLSARLSMPLMRAVRGDTRNPAGLRCVGDGAVRALEGFECNEAQRPKLPDDFRCHLLHSERGDRLLVKTTPFATDSLLTDRVRRATHYRVGLIVAAIPLAKGHRFRLYKCIDEWQPVDLRVAPALMTVAEVCADKEPVLYCAALSVSYLLRAGHLWLPYDSGRQDLLRMVRVFSA